MKIMNAEILNDGNPIEIGKADGFMFTVSPSTAKKNRAYYTDKQVKLTKYELRMPGVVICQNRGMIFSSSKKINGNYIIPQLSDMNIIIVDEVSRTLKPTDDKDNVISWKGNGPHEVKDVIADGQGQHWLCDKDGKLAVNLWLKWAKMGYGIKGMLQPGLATDIGKTITDHWGVDRTITLGNTILLNSSLVKGLSAYESLEELKEHGEIWGMTTLYKQWQSGDHKVAERRIMGTQPNATNLTLTMSEIEELVKPEARAIWANKFEKIAWMKNSNVKTARGRAIAARPELMYKDLIMNQVDCKANNQFMRLAQGKFMAEGQYLKMYMDKLVYSLVYVHGMDPNSAARKAAETGLHGEIRVNPSFAGYCKSGYKKETGLDNKGRFIETALVRYPHGAPSETIIVKAYLDVTVPSDVIVFPAPVANEDGTIPVSVLYAMRLQGADFDGDAVTAFTEKIWVEAQKRNIGKAYMVIPVNTEGTEKDKTKVTDDDFEVFCQMKVESLSNKVGLIATSLKYFMSQCAESMRNGDNAERDEQVIVNHACAMGDDIDEFKHGKANNDIVPFVVPGEDEPEILFGPYFNRYKKYKSLDQFRKSVYTKTGITKIPGKGTLDMYAVATEKLMAKCGLPIKPEVTKATDNKERYYFAVHPVGWEAKDVDLYCADRGQAQRAARLPKAFEDAYGVENGTQLFAKELFMILYKDHNATIQSLGEIGDKGEWFKAIENIRQRTLLAKAAIVCWVKEMKRNMNEEISTQDALVFFTTLMTQHTKSSRSIIEVMSRTGTVTRHDGTTYEKELFSAQRIFNYFLDVCGDGLLFTKINEPDFPDVAESIIAATGATAPDMQQALDLANKENELIDKIISLKDPVGEVKNVGGEDHEDFVEDDCSFSFDELDLEIDPEWI